MEHAVEPGFHVFDADPFDPGLEHSRNIVDGMGVVGFRRESMKRERLLDLRPQAPVVCPSPPFVDRVQVIRDDADFTPDPRIDMPDSGAEMAIRALSNPPHVVVGRAADRIKRFMR